MVFAVAFTAFGAPAWAGPEPNVQDRPPIDAQKQPETAPSAPRDPGSGSGGSASPPTAPPTAGSTALDGDAEVEPFDEARSMEYFAVAPEHVPEEKLEKVRNLDGVASVEVVDAARVKVEGADTSVLGIDPSGFRNYAPEPSAESDEIWQGIAEGRIALSDEAGKQRELDVGGKVGIAGGQGEVTREVWTHATSGVAGIDALISRGLARELGFPEGNGLIISAPDADLRELGDELDRVMGGDAGLQVLADDLEPRPADSAGDPVGASVIEQMIAAAESQKGVPYVWGGESLDEGGYDCSGLVQWAFAETGVAVPRVTHDQWYAGERVGYDNARRGDLIFWRSDPTAPDYISHVAIYLGDGRMLEAPSTGLTVRETAVRTDQMAGVVRVHTAE